MFNAISLFSGCGGCCLGLKQAGFDIKLAVDINRDACETYAANLGAEEILQLDLTNIAPEEILKASQLNPFEIDLIVAGPPCQGFSSAGTKSWHDPRNILFKKAVEIIIKLQPTWFILENVEGVLTSKDGFYMIEAIARFLDAGYWVLVQKLYMEKYGFPQKRKRVFIVGNLAECQFYFPSGIYDNNPQLSLFDKYPQLSILDAIGDLPSPQTTVNFPNNSGNFYDKLPHCDYQTQLRQTEAKPLFHHQIKQINSITQERINLLTPGGTMKDLPVNLLQAEKSAS